MKKIQNTCSFFLLVSALVLAACGFTYEEPVDTIDAKAPVIDTQPAANTTYTLGQPPITLSISARLQDDGALSYQWYTYTQARDYQDETGTPVPDAKSESFSPVYSEGGTYRYYAVVTNTNNKATGKKSATVKSGRVTVTVNDPNSAQFPEITTQPQNTAAYYDPPNNVTVTLSVAASVTDGGILSYQWYSNSTAENTGGTKINGAENASYTHNISSAGGSVTYYYYCVVTNTKSGTANSTTSDAATVREAGTFNATFTVNTATKYQYVRGFGAMSTGGFRAGNGSTSPDVNVSDIEKAFNPDTGLGLNFLRIMLYDDLDAVMNGTCSPSLNRANMDISDYFDIVKKVNEYGGYVLASPWTPPAAWKSNNSLVGPSSAKLNTNRYVDYANHLRNFCIKMVNNGAPIYAVSIQNEPNADVGYEGCNWSSTEMRNFFNTSGVGAFTRNNSAGTSAPIKGWGGGKETPYVLIMNGETMSDMSINSGVMNDQSARNSIDLIGRHMYGGRTSYYDTASQYNKEVFMTEYTDTENMSSHYPNMHRWEYMWRFLNVLDWSIRMNNENAFIWWYMKRFYCIIGDGDQSAIDGQILPRGYAMSHYAKFAKDTMRVQVTPSGTTGSGTAITAGSNVNNTTYNLEGTAPRVTAFESMDGNAISLVMFTPTSYSNTGNGTNMGAVKIKLPAGFVIDSAEAVRSTADVKFQPADVVVSADGNSAYVTLPASNILSVRFTK